MERLYYNDAYLGKFSSEVIEISEKGIVLEKTAFFPEGGGQSSDIGTLGGAYIHDVQEENGIIYHKTRDTVTFSVGDTVEGEIDFKKRFSDMQNHSGEHIVSGVIHNTYGYDNVGFHLNDKEIALDFSGEIPTDDIKNIELEANKAVWKNIEIKAFFPDKTQIENISYRSKKEIEGDIRLVEIEGVDVCACCAPHVKITGEIGVIKIVGAQKHRGGTRLYILCGERALEDYGKKQNENKKTGALLKVPEYETSGAVEALLKKKAELEYEIVKLGMEKAEICARIYKESEVIVAVEEISGQALTHFANELSKKAGRFVAVFGKVGESAYRYMVLSNGEDVTSMVKDMNTALCGRGGGKNGVAQGSVSCTRERILDFFDRYTDKYT